MVCHTIFLATCEGASLAERAGLDVAQLIDVFNHANARSYASEVRFPRDILSGRWNGRSRVFNLHKDLSSGVAFSERLRADAAFSRLTLAFLEAAMARGMADEDFTLLYRDFDRLRRLAPTAARSGRVSLRHGDEGPSDREATHRGSGVWRQTDRRRYRP